MECINGYAKLHIQLKLYYIQLYIPGLDVNTCKSINNAYLGYYIYTLVRLSIVNIIET